MKRWVFRGCIALGIVTIIGLVVILVQNDFNMIEKSVEIKTSSASLNGTLVLPKDVSGKVGLVVFIHGDGSADASYNDAYKPLWEMLAQLGYASLS